MVFRWTFGAWMLLAAASSCTSIEWQPLPMGVPVSWRHLQVYRLDPVYVLARDEQAASEAVESLATLLQRVRAATVFEPGPGLVIAVSHDDPLLIEDPKAWVEFVVESHQAHARGARKDPGSGLAAVGVFGKGGSKSLLELALSEGAKIASGGLPHRDRRLPLPAELTEQVGWVLVMPTATCIEAAVDVVVDAALEEAELSFFERLLVAPFLSSALSDAYEGVQRGVDRAAVDVWLATTKAPPEVRRACLAELGYAVDLRGTR